MIVVHSIRFLMAAFAIFYWIFAHQQVWTTESKLLPGIFFIALNNKQVKVQMRVKLAF